MPGWHTNGRDADGDDERGRLSDVFERDVLPGRLCRRDAMRAWYVWRERRLTDVYTVPCRRVSRCKWSDSVQGVHRWLLLRSRLVQPAAVPSWQAHRYVAGRHDERGSVHHLLRRLVLLGGRGDRDAVRAWHNPVLTVSGKDVHALTTTDRVVQRVIASSLHALAELHLHGLDRISDDAVDTVNGRNIQTPQQGGLRQ